jgi:hypothetical protein
MVFASHGRRGSGQRVLQEVPETRTRFSASATPGKVLPKCPAHHNTYHARQDADEL